MSAFVYVITNSLGSGDYVVVYETECGATIFEGHSVRPRELFDIIDSTSGGYDGVRYRELTDEEMECWQDHIFG